MISNQNNNSLFYIPRITEFAEYDFKNWQSLELLEDSIWESSLSTFAGEDYLSLKNDFKEMKQADQRFKGDSRSENEI